MSVGGTVIMEPVIGRAAVEVNLAPALRGRPARLAAGRPVVIDYYASRLRGVVVGELDTFVLRGLGFAGEIPA
jgi:hypothetical protein